MTLRVVSYGGGVQSTALLVLAAERAIDYRTFLFANVGDDSEHPATLRYVREVAEPFAADAGIELYTLRRRRRDGRTETLYNRLTRPGSRFEGIPVRLTNGKPGKRACTADFKIAVLGRWLRAHGATPDEPAVVGIGYSLDEIQRIGGRASKPYERRVYPLVSVGEETGLHLRRGDCEAIIADAGLPVPPKSACWFCPFHRPSVWAEIARDTPELFDRAADLERLLNRRRDEEGRPPVYLTGARIPLRQAIDTDQPLLPFGDDDGECDEGYCFT